MDDDTFVTDFMIAEDAQAVLGVLDKEEPFRRKVAAAGLDRTSFSTTLQHVQHGTYDRHPATMLAIDLDFSFDRESSSRFHKCEVAFTFEEKRNDFVDDNIDPDRDPIVVLFGPKEIHGDVSTVGHTREWKFEIPVKAQQMGLEAGLSLSGSEIRIFDRDHRLWIDGHTRGDDQHKYDNKVFWFLKENSVQQSGIPKRLRVVVVIVWPSHATILAQMKVRIKPIMAFAWNPVLKYMLEQKRHQPVTLDRHTEKGIAVRQDLDFSDPDFPWSTILQSPGDLQGAMLV